MATYTLPELDSLSDDQFKAVLESDLDAALVLHAAQHDTMVRAHVAMASDIDGGEPGDIDWRTDIRTDFDLYAELRVNGYYFARVEELRLAM
jgi:hypothetical protein